MRQADRGEQVNGGGGVDEELTGLAGTDEGGRPSDGEEHERRILDRSVKVR